MANLLFKAALESGDVSTITPLVLYKVGSTRIITLGSGDEIVVEAVWISCSLATEVDVFFSDTGTPAFSQAGMILGHHMAANDVAAMIYPVGHIIGPKGHGLFVQTAVLTVPTKVIVTGKILRR